jgi:prepilin-type N-terminal cleavage/methylation domain-containing protein
MKLSTSSSHERFRRACGMTLPELMIAIGVGSVVLMLVCTVFMTGNRAFADMGNYVSLNRASREALELMTRDIRNSDNLISFSTNRLEFNYDETTKLVFTFDPARRELTRSKTGETNKVVLSNCDALEFTMYKGVPVTGGTFGKTTDPMLGKSISVSWKCSRNVLGQQRDSESIEQALIVIRNKPVL